MQIELAKESASDGYEVIYHLLKKIIKDPAITRQVQFPTFNTLRERVWSNPLIFIFEGETCPSVIFPWRLCEVSQNIFSISLSHPIQTANNNNNNNDNNIASQTFISNEEETNNNNNVTLMNKTYYIKTSRFELVGTVFAVESYEVVEKCTTPLHPLYNSYNSENNRKQKKYQPKIIRIITNESGLPLDEKTATYRMKQLVEEKAYDIFLQTFIPLLGANIEECEKKWSYCVTNNNNNNNISQSDSESAGVSSLAYSNQSVNEETNRTSPNLAIEMHNLNLFFHQDNSSTVTTTTTTTTTTNNNNNNNSNSNNSNNNNIINLAKKSNLNERYISSLTPITPNTNSADFTLRLNTLYGLFEQEERYYINISAAWARWTNDWSEVKRYSVVNSIDDIITSLQGSREAVYVAVAYLDHFLYNSQIIKREQIYFSGVLLACCLLACKQVDRFFPPMKSFLRCLGPESSISEAEFFHYEMHVLEKLNFHLQPITTLEVVELLLYLCSGAEIQEYLQHECQQQEGRRWGGNNNNNNNTFNIHNIINNCCDDYNINNCDNNNTFNNWGAMCEWARRLTDIMLRECNAQQFKCTTLAFAIVTHASEKCNWPLPAPFLLFNNNNNNTNTDDNNNNNTDNINTDNNNNNNNGVVLDNDSFELLRHFAVVVSREGILNINKILFCVKEAENNFLQRPIEGVLMRRYGMSETVGFL